MKTSLKIMAVVFVAVLTLTLAACAGQSHEHTFAGDWSHDDASHWHAADCEHTGEVADKSAHTFTAQVTKEQTCTEDGAQTLTCSACGYTKTEAIAAGHALEQVEAKEATCKEPGWDAYEKCTRCDYTTYAEKTASHTFEKGVCTGCQIDYDTSWFTPDANCYYIDSPQAFVGLGRLVNGGTYDFKNKWIYLTTNLSFDGRTLFPIGDSGDGRQFLGWFDGGGYIISDFVIGGYEKEGYHKEAVGLFGFLGNSAKVMRLGISNFTVDVTDSTTRYVGGLVGHLGNGNVARCYAVNGSVKGCGDAYVGGLVGITMGGRVGHSYTDVTVTGKYVGGILGSLSKSFTGKSGEVEACFSLGTLTGSSCVNPIVHTYNSEKVTKCYYWEDQQYPGRWVEMTGIARSATKAQLCSSDFIFETLGWSTRNSWVIHENALPTLVQGVQENK
jgi:hypothetical protein